ncbi:hypothetical protein VNO78_28664 [Psophocarpus tetragonolobus]|uniref:Glycosyltransferase n=1 Tax=Psophocarpus tetragonolobus TaxID=3891 RepID=A0AAN9RTK7_PSOTE
MKKAARLVFIPFPGVSHLASTLEFAKLLINRDERIWITVLVIKLPNSQDDATAGLERLEIINLPDCESHKPITDIVEQQKPHVKQVVSELKLRSSGVPLAGFVVDMFCTTMIDVAKHFELPSLVFFTSALAFLALMLHLHSLREQGDTDFKTQDQILIPTFANPVPSTALPSSVLNKDWDSFFVAFGRGLLKADAIVINSFQDLESHVLANFNSKALSLSLSLPLPLPPIYPVGPILNSNNTTDSGIIFNWLDQQPPSSVVFLCFGSMGSFGEDQVREIARALQNSAARFLWSLRKPPPKASSFINPPTDYAPSDLLQLLPPHFFDRTAAFGMVIGWAPQAQILAHPATGAFVSHCGWNSILESIYFGVPIATWPLYAEQQTNAFLLVRELNLAVDIAMDYRVDFKARPNFLVSADKIEKGIRTLMNMDQETRRRLKEMSQKSRNTSLEGGSSYSYLGRLIDYIIDQRGLGLPPNLNQPPPPPYQEPPGPNAAQSPPITVAQSPNGGVFASGDDMSMAIYGMAAALLLLLQF